MGTFCVGGGNACSPVVAIDDGFTLIDSDNDASMSVGGGVAYKIGTTAAEDPAWSAGNVSDGMAAHMIIFKHI